MKHHHKSLPLFCFALSVCCLIAQSAIAHDTWVETNTSLIRSGDAIYIDLKLGNHGNDHRDFKLASKLSLDKATLHVSGPGLDQFDLKNSLNDLGYAPKEGYWSAKFVPDQSGLYTVTHTIDSVHHNTRGIKSAKTFFISSPSLDKVDDQLEDFDKASGHDLELIPLTNPVAPLGPGKEIQVQLLYQGKPMPDAVISFVPRGETLKEGFDETYERRTDVEGKARFTPKTGNWYLIVAHHSEPDQKGEGFSKTSFSATLTVLVPEICPCCSE